MTSLYPETLGKAHAVLVWKARVFAGTDGRAAFGPSSAETPILTRLSD
ncbi:MAG: hypothetical protein N2423_06715 [Novosphingobium sp.]|nr:hypothetical protein [Novosphingobium sp.]